jgi:putative hemolysin
MAIKTFAAVSAAVLLLAGCGVPSDVVPVGRDSYMISATAIRQAASKAPIGAAQGASRYCEQQGRHMIIRHTDQIVPADAPVTYTLVFSCVTDTDPEYQRPTLRNDVGVLTQTH